MTSEKYCSEKVVHVRHAHVSKNYIPLSWLRACYIHTHISQDKYARNIWNLFTRI